MKIIAKNRKAYHDFSVLDKYEAGIVLLGTEVKSMREGKVNFTDSYALLDKNELFLQGLDVAPYGKASVFNHAPKRRRKLLLHKSELRKVHSLAEQKGLTLVPLLLYFNDKGIIKVELGACKGKRHFDKRDDIASKEAFAAIKKAMKTR
jgi:SsrA-binding protein